MGMNEAHRTVDQHIAKLWGFKGKHANVTRYGITILDLATLKNVWKDFSPFSNLTKFNDYKKSNSHFVVEFCKKYSR